MRIELTKVKGEIERFQREIALLEQQLTARKNAMLAKLAEMLGMGAAAPAGKAPGRKPAAKAAVRKPGVDRAGRMHGEETLPQMILKILRQSKSPLNAREIYERLQKLGWQTASDHPQIFVYKTLHRIEKMGVIVRAERGRYKAPK